MKGRRNRLELEAHFAKADRMSDLAERLFCELVGLFVTIDEMHGPAEDGLIERAPRRGLAAPLQLGDVLAQQIAKGKMPAEHLGVAVDQAGAEQALQRPHQSPLIAFQVFGERGAPKRDAVLVGVEEYGRG